MIGLGYLGAALAEALLARGETVVGLESGFSTDEAALLRLARVPGFRVVRGSAGDPAAVTAAFAAARPRNVYLFAAQASADPDAAPAWYTEEVNLRAPRIVLDAAVQFGTTAVVYASSFHVYGYPLEGLVTEDRRHGRFHDLSHLSKCYGEKLVEMYAGRHGLHAASLRLGICYGLSPVMKRDYRFMTVPNKFCLQVVRGEPLVVHATGQRPLAFVHVADAVGAAVTTAAALGSTWTGSVPVNVVGEVATAVAVATNVAAAAAARGLDARVELQRDDRPGMPGHPRPFTVRSRLDETGFRPLRRLEDGVGDVLEHFLRATAAP